MTDNSAASSQRPRPAILAALAVALIALVAYSFWPAARQPGAPSNAAREQRRQAAKNASDAPGAFEVRLGALQQAPPAPDAETARNPFRFYVKPPPPPPPPPRVPKPGDEDFGPAKPLPPPQPVGPPPIPLKFIGTLEVKGQEVAIFRTTRGIPACTGRRSRDGPDAAS